MIKKLHVPMGFSSDFNRNAGKNDADLKLRSRAF
jgi:hypothetical protein